MTKDKGTVPCQGPAIEKTPHFICSVRSSVAVEIILLQKKYVFFFFVVVVVVVFVAEMRLMLLSAGFDFPFLS